MPTPEELRTVAQAKLDAATSSAQEAQAEAQRLALEASNAYYTQNYDDLIDKVNQATVEAANTGSFNTTVRLDSIGNDAARREAGMETWHAVEDFFKSEGYPTVILSVVDGSMWYGDTMGPDGKYNADLFIAWKEATV